MIDLEPRYFRSAPRARVAAATPSLSHADRRRAVCFVTLAAALAAMLVLPSEAPAGWPLPGEAAPALGFGETYTAPDGTSSTHRGTDVSGAAGSPVRAPLSGRVSFAGRVPGLGGGTVLAVTIATESGSLTLLPLDSTSVTAGAHVAEGDLLGDLADAGDPSSAGTHLHVSMRKGDLYVDPLPLMAPPAPAGGSSESPQPSPAAQPEQGRVPAEVPAAPRLHDVRHGAASPAAAPAVEPAPSSVVRPGVVVAGGPVSVAVPGAGVAPGVSIPSAAAAQAGGGSTMHAVAAAVSAAVDGARSGDGSRASGLAEWVLRAAEGSLRAGARVLAGVLLALGALWPIWRRERRKGAGELSVRPLGDDVAAVTGR